MAMTKGQMILAVGMLITGTINSVFTNAATKEYAEGTESPATMWDKIKHPDFDGEWPVEHEFDHPYFCCVIMFSGEFLCMLAYLATRDGQERESTAATRPPGENYYFAIPAMCDMFGTGTMYAGMCLSSVSVFQMLRGSSIIFTAVISVIFLGKKQYNYQWFSVALVIVGILVVGYVSTHYADDDSATLEERHPSDHDHDFDQDDTTTTSSDEATVMIGNCLIVGAQLVVAMQMVVEEFLANKYKTPSLKAVGLEGTYGFCILGFLMIPMFYMRFDGAPFENAPDALSQMGNNMMITFFMVCSMCSIAFFNFFGISVTKSMSAAHRMVLDSVRTLTVWGASLIIGWEVFHWEQIIGFTILTLGCGAYNGIIILPYFEYPSSEALVDDVDADAS